jgi:hypothetical protein
MSWRRISTALFSPISSQAQERWGLKLSAAALPWSTSWIMLLRPLPQFATISLHWGSAPAFGLNPVALRRLSASPERCGIVFLDPPYAAGEDYARTLTYIGQLADSLLSPGGMVIAEHSRKTALEESYGPLQRYRVLEQGDAGLSFYKLT